MNWIKKFYKFLASITLVLLSSLITFVFLEISYRFYKNNILEENTFGTLFFQYGNVFRNVENFFTYYPNIENRRIKTFTFLENNQTNTIVEYDYSITTNNLGLIMKNDIVDNENIDLFIGDSFTEGQGAIPWFYKLENQWFKETKPMNGGILGTGPMQWYELAQFFKNKYDLNYKNIHVIMILRDFIRPLWNLKAQVINCIETTKCFYSSNFHGFDLTNTTHDDLIEHVNYLSNNYPKEPQSIDKEKTIYGNLRYLLKSSYIILDLYTYFRDEYAIYIPITKQNFQALDNLKKIADNKITISVINKKNTNLNDINNIPNKNILFSLLEWGDLNKVKINICQFEDIYFHEYDEHLNKQGYDKLMECVLKLT